MSRVEHKSEADVLQCLKLRGQWRCQAGLSDDQNGKDLRKQPSAWAFTNCAVIRTAGSWKDVTPAVTVSARKAHKRRRNSAVCREQTEQH